MALPPLSEILSSPPSPNAPLASALSTLFEPTPILLSKLVPQLASLPPSIALTTTSYSALIDLALTVLSSWPVSSKAEFISGHPRIGEISNLSVLSQQEQAAKATAPEVLRRLEVLNRLYERKYPGLIYITFVNGRTRAEIRDEMEKKLGVGSGDWEGDGEVEPLEVGGVEWTGELDRAIRDVGLIAKSRLRALGVV